MLDQQLPAPKPMSGAALAVTRRPLLFKNVIAQGAVVSELLAMVASGVVSHVIFVGESGVGKTTIARLFAKLLNCTRPSVSEPCGQCASCRMIDEGGRHRAYHERNAAGPEGSKDGVADFLEHDLGRVPPGYSYRVVFWDEAQNLSAYALDLLLKPLEELGSKTIFILAMIDGDRLPETFQDRCRIIRLKTPTIEEKLLGLEQACAEEGIRADTDALQLIAERSRGFRQALAKLQRVRDAAEGQSSISVVLTRKTLFHAESNVAVAFLNAAFAGNMPAALTAVGQLGRDATSCFQAVQRVLLHLKKTIIGPHLALPTRGDRLLYDEATTETLVALIARIAARVNQPVPIFYDAVLEHWTHVPPATPEAFEAHAIRFVDLCSSYDHDDDPVETLDRVPLMTEPYRSTRGRRARISRRCSQAQSLPRDQFISADQAVETYEAATFLVQEHGVALNAALPLNFSHLDRNAEAGAAALFTALGRELAQRFAAWAPTGAPAGGLHRLSSLGRDDHGEIIGVMLFHLPDTLASLTERWLEAWVARNALKRGLSAPPFTLEFRAPTDPRNAIDRQWRLLRRHIWSGVDPDDRGQGALLIDRLGVPERQRRPAGSIAGPRLHKSESISRKSRSKALREGMGHVSALRSGRWDQLFSAWELREHREREALRAYRTERLAIFAARRAATGDTMARTLIDQLERDERARWVINPLDRPRGRPCWSPEPRPATYGKEN